VGNTALKKSDKNGVFSWVWEQIKMTDREVNRTRSIERGEKGKKPAKRKNRISQAQRKKQHGGPRGATGLGHPIPLFLRSEQKKGNSRKGRQGAQQGIGGKVQTDKTFVTKSSRGLPGRAG